VPSNLATTARSTTDPRNVIRLAVRGARSATILYARADYPINSSPLICNPVYVLSGLIAIEVIPTGADPRSNK